MAVVDRLLGKTERTADPKGQDIPNDVSQRIERGRKRMVIGAQKRNECLEFARSNQYVYVDKDNFLVQQGVVRGQVGKPAHRIRVTWNLLTPHLEHEMSACTKRVPFYQINPATNDPQDQDAASLSTKVAAFGYDAWKIKGVTEKVAALAIIADGGFAWPYFDNTVGAPIGQDDEGNTRCVGDIRIRVFGPNEVYWEPGVKFEDSRWHVVEQARSIEDVQEMEGFLGVRLTPDAATSEVLGEGKRPQGNNLVLVREYLERPSPGNPKGKRLVIVAGKVICTPQDYPCLDDKGQPVDEPVLHYLTRIIDPDSDRDQGLVRHTLDACRTWNDCTNKLLEWKNLALNPQILAPRGAFVNKKRVTDEPGAIIEYNPVGGSAPQWRPTPPIPQELFRLRDEAQDYVARVFSQNDLPDGVDSGKALSVSIERDDNTREGFIGRLAEFHSRLMRHCLYLVARHYTEPRLLQIRGQFGPESIADFIGSDLRSQCHVRVFPDSIAPLTKQDAVDKIQWFATVFPGAITPERAMLAIQTGHTEELLESFERDRARAYRVIQQIRSGPQEFLAAPMVPGPNGEEVPGWMPRPFDSIPVHKQVFEDFMKTVDYETAEDPIKTALGLYYEALQQLEAEKQAEAVAQQNALAAQQGMTNAAAPQGGPKALPSPAAIGR